MSNRENENENGEKKEDNNNNNNNERCSICMEVVTYDSVGRRGIANLACDHRFHLDCIGSAFNFKGAMQCPNCRSVEQGRWLYASGPTRSIQEISTRPIQELTWDDWVLYGDQMGLSYHEIPLNMHWCPFSGMARAPSAFESLEALPPAYHNLHRNHNMFAEHGAPSVPHSFITYLRPIPSASLNTNETMEDPNLTYHWNVMSNPHPLPVTDNNNNDMHHHNGVHHSPLPSLTNTHASGTDQAPVPPVTLRSSRGEFGAMPRSGTYMHRFPFGHGRSHERLQPSHTIHHPHRPTNPIIPSMARFYGRRALAQPPIPANPVSNRNGGIFIIPTQSSPVRSSHETENLLPVVDLNRAGNFWRRHRS